MMHYTIEIRPIASSRLFSHLREGTLERRNIREKEHLREGTLERGTLERRNIRERNIREKEH
jgi:hypothetical protein